MNQARCRNSHSQCSMMCGGITNESFPIPKNVPLHTKPCWLRVIVCYFLFLLPLDFHRIIFIVLLFLFFFLFLFFSLSAKRQRNRLHPCASSLSPSFPGPVVTHSMPRNHKRILPMPPLCTLPLVTWF